MSIISTPVIDNNKNKSKCILSSRNVFYVETATKRKQNDSIFISFDFNETYVGNVYITDRNGRKTDRCEFKVTVSLLAQSEGHLTCKSGVLGSIPGLATYFRFSFRFFKKGSC